MSEDKAIIAWLGTIENKVDKGFERVQDGIDKVLKKCEERIEVHTETCEIKKLFTAHIEGHEENKKKMNHG